jgi:glycerol-3-phosphate acyltransferase PlsX
MSDSSTVTVCVDAAGGDDAPQAVLDGVVAALAHDPDLDIVLAGPGRVVEEFAKAQAPRVRALATSQVISMEEHPAEAVRQKRDSSIVVGCRAVREGRADAFFSAGSTGAAMAAATLVIGRIKGARRPAIATVLPTRDRPTLLLDVGANADARAEDLLQFAHMGRTYSSAVLGTADPRVALLNIGEEPTKGSQLAIDAHKLIAEQVPGFVGNVEGRDVMAGTADVIVTDGFTGNVSLKLLEGTSRVLLGQVKEVLTASLAAKTAAAIVAPGLRELKERIDPDTYGGAPLLGVNGVCIIGHGSSSARAVANAIGLSARAVRGGLVAGIRDSLRAPDSTP